MGVGLSIANGIWRRHRGTLAAQEPARRGDRVRLCVDPVEGGLPGAAMIADDGGPSRGDVGSVDRQPS